MRFEVRSFNHNLQNPKQSWWPSQNWVEFIILFCVHWITAHSNNNSNNNAIVIIIITVSILVIVVTVAVAVSTLHFLWALISFLFYFFNIKKGKNTLMLSPFSGSKYLSIVSSQLRWNLEFSSLNILFRSQFLLTLELQKLIKQIRL